MMPEVGFKPTPPFGDQKVMNLMRLPKFGASKLLLRAQHTVKDNGQCAKVRILKKSNEENTVSFLAF